MPKHAAIDPSELTDMEWRRLGGTLWAGRGPDGPVGTIERGRRYNAVDTEGLLVGRCRRLQEAEALLEHLAGIAGLPGGDRADPA
jgi:hypothetical protein